MSSKSVKDFKTYIQQLITRNLGEDYKLLFVKVSDGCDEYLGVILTLTLMLCIFLHVIMFICGRYSTNVSLTT